MPDYEVTLIKTIKTKVRVNAYTALQAKLYVRQYGVIEAASDMPVLSEDVEARISAVKVI